MKTGGDLYLNLLRYIRNILTHIFIKPKQTITPKTEEPVITRGRFDTLQVTHKDKDIWTCRCMLCGKFYKVNKSEFIISKSTTKGYYSNACCNCHSISSFQWRTIDILNKHNIDYQTEYSFSDLKGINGGALRFDFVVYDKDTGKIKCFIECQGIQHYKPVAEFGGEEQFKIQTENDKRKRVYLQRRNIKLVELDYRQCMTYDCEESVLRFKGVI